jgi:predicted Fe-S protein YdhL (DUF1289 family)
MEKPLCKFLCVVPIALAAASASAQPLMQFPDDLLSPTEHLFWDQMDDAQRAALWPVLSQEQRLAHWRFMDKAERRALRNNLKPYRGPLFRLHYAGIRHSASINAPRQMTDEELSLLRRQVHRVSIELRSGVPFECSDPRNCPSVLVRFTDNH